MHKLIDFYNQNKRRNNYIYFTVIFLLTLCVIFSVFIIQNKSFIWIAGGSDGLDQHYTSLMYYGEYLRTILKNLLITHQEIPLWDFSIGYGADIITTFHYYVLGDPLALLSVFVPMQYTEYLYTLLIIIRYYLVGISFITYCHYMGKVSWSTFIGALSYAFCGFAIYAGIKHPYFLNPMIYLPIIFIGIEKIYQKESPILFIVITFVSAISNFYFFYMLCIIMFIYAVIRFFHYYHENYIHNIIKKLIQFIAYFLIGLGLSAIVLVPVILMFFNTARSQDRSFIPLLYSMSYYIELFFGFISSGRGSYWTLTGFSSISFFCLITLFFSRKKNTSFIISWLLCVVFLSLPVFGVIFNGFSYICNRWCFAYAFLMSFIIVESMPKLLTLTKKQYFVLVIGFMVEVIMTFLNKQIQEYMMISLFILAIILIILSLQYKREIIIRKLIVGLCICTIISIQWNALYRYIVQDYSQEYLTAHQAYQKITQNYLNTLSQVNDSSFYRYDKSIHSQKNLNNISVIQKKYPLSFFFSLANGYITEFFNDVKNVNILSSVYNGLDTRSPLLSLSSTKYFITEKDNTTYIPYGFIKMETIQDQKYDIYFNQNYLPLGYTYDTQIKREYYDQLTALEKQNTLLKSVLLDEDISLKENKQEKIDYHIPIQIKYNDHIRREGNQISVDKNNASLDMVFQLEKDKDVYISFDQLKLKQSYYAQTLLKAIIQVKDENMSGNITVYSPYNSYYNGTENYLKHVGYLEKGEHHLEVIFKNKGIYNVDDIQILGQSLDEYQQDICQLRKDTLQNEKVEANCIKGNITLQQRKFLCFSIPYSSGWKAYVDGQEVDLLQANTMYMGIALDKGSHSIELRYLTPGLKVGCYISLGSVVLLFFVFIGCKRRYK